MEVVIAGAEQLAELAAEAVASLLTRHPESTIGLATGSSLSAVYGELISKHRAEGLSFAHARGFLLDEYVGLPAGHPQRYRNVIAAEIADPVHWPAEQVMCPDGMAEDLRAACAAYEREIAHAGGVDLQLLGLGADGHIAFNEPSSSLASRTRIKTLTAQTRTDNARFFGGDIDQVPLHCLTQGLGTIRDARHLVLLAQGRHKAEAVYQLVEGPVSARWPATVLQLHPHVSVLVDESAASRLQLADYYRHAYANKPVGHGL